MIESFRAVLIASLPLSAASAAAQSDSTATAGNRMLPFAALAPISDEAQETRSPVYCDAERSLCIQAWRGSEAGWTLDVHEGLPTRPNAAIPRRIALPIGDEPDRETHSIWPHLVREASGALLIGVARMRSAGFSGGGASETHTLLFRLNGDAAPVPVLAVKTGYGAMIRACFTEAEYAHRGACHDEYELTGTFTLAPEADAGRPRLILTTAARSFPRGVRNDESETRRYRRADLVWEADPACSYRRVFRVDPATGSYAPDAPLPECSIYALP